ncbi:HAD-IC family P-type ATPase [Legionella feeleii]|uniref:HAD-IC family P-type ATPase n=2 Tax=Legionella feeleii TaxID=453 RepID=UPI0007D07C45|nr:HAD-IC family P-type ATPase [Legionella feeleii]
MSFRYFRFYLSESGPYDAEELSQSLSTSEKELGFIRVSFDLTSDDPSISILCESDEEMTHHQDKWSLFFQNSHIKVKEKIEHEVLEDEERLKVRCSHEHELDCSHDHHGEHDHHKHHGKHDHHKHHGKHDHHKHHGEHDHHKHHGEHDHHKHHDEHAQHKHHDEHAQHKHHGEHAQHKHHGKHAQDKHHGEHAQHKRHGEHAQHKHHGEHAQHKHHGKHDHHKHHDHHDHHDRHWLKAAVGLVYGVGLLTLFVAGINIPMLAYYLITGSSTLVTLYLGHRVYQSAWNAVLQRKWEMSSLYTISTLTIIAVSTVSFFVPGLPMMLESAPLILGFWHLGEAIEHTLLDKLHEKLDIRDCVSETALLKAGGERKIPVKQLVPNDIIILNKGDVIPVDGVLLQSALLYTTRIDGSPHLKQFNPGDVVKAGMCLANHMPQLEMRVTKTYQNSYLSLIAKKINKANDEKAPVELLANQILKYFVPGLLTVALVSGVVVGSLFSPVLAIQCVISVLVSACPCALSMITPMAVRIGMKKASEKGVHYKDGKTLQSASDIDTVVFDLNGTLTQGEVSVSSLFIEEKNKPLLKFIALLESKAPHPVGKTVKDYIEKQGVLIDDSLEVASPDTSHHSGIKGIISGETFMVGNRDMLRANGIDTINPPYDDNKNGTVYMVRGSEVIGQIALTDKLRADAIATVKQLQSMGKQVHICTGADLETAKQYATLLGIPLNNICANTVGVSTSDEEVSKDSYIRKLQRQGRKVAMVGDAANDLLAIGEADIGIAVESSIGDKLTKQKAGIVVQQGLLFPIATAFDVASKTKQNISQNLFVSLTYNSVITLVASGLFVALDFALNPAMGVALMVVESALVLANLYRLKHQETVSPASLPENRFESVLREETTYRVLKSLGLGPKSSVELQGVLQKEASRLPVSTAPGGWLGLFNYCTRGTGNSSEKMVMGESAVFGQ